jgi:hypothetical protein
MALRYWVGGTGTWNTSSTTNWSATSGGGSGASAPTSADDVIFNASSGTGTVTINQATTGVTCKSVDASLSSVLTIAGSTPNAAQIACVGSFILKSGLTWSAVGNINITGTGTLTAYDCITAADLTINGTGITVTLGSNFTLAANRLTLTAGTFNASTYNVNIDNFSGSGSTTRTLTMGSGTWTLSGTGSLWNLSNITGLTFNKGSANINLSDTSTTTKTFVGAGFTYNGLSITGTTGISEYRVNGSNTFSYISSLKTVAYSIRLDAGTTTTVTSFTASGSSGNLLKLYSATAGTAATLAGTTGTVDYAGILDVNLSSANTLIATNSNVANSNNWNIAPTSKRWVALTTGTSWTSPSDWKSTGNEIHVLGGGGGGAGNITTTIAGGAGGGGAGYAGATNLSITPSNSYTYAIGAAGTGTAGSTTTSTGGTGGTSSITIGSTTYTATGGTGGAATSTPTSTAGVGGTGGIILPPTYVNSTTSVQNSSGSTITMTVPSGISNGNLLVMYVAMASNARTWTTPAGWTVGTAQDTSRAVYWRVASSEPASYTVTHSGTETSSGVIIAYANAAWDTSGLAAQTAASPVTPVAITVGTTNSAIVYVASQISSSLTFTTPTGYTARASDSDATGPSMAVFDITGIASGSYTGPSTTPSSGTAKAFTIALSPVLSTTGVTAYTGGSGGAGAISGATVRYGGGAGGSAGPNGNGGNGAAGVGNTAAGGGGGNGGGTNASGSTAGTGYGSGLGGAGGAGSVNATFAGGDGIDGLEIILGLYGSGGGSGGGGSSAGNVVAGLYGAGGSGVGTNSATARTGATGKQGIVIVGYAGTYGSGNFFSFF